MKMINKQGHGGMWALGCAAVLAAGVLLPAGEALAEDDVRLRLNWMYYGSHAGFALGKDRGDYDAEGLDLDIRAGPGAAIIGNLAGRPVGQQRTPDPEAPGRLARHVG